MSHRRIFLVGYMASGKTTLGRLVAQRLGLSFIDLDHYIESRQCMKIVDLFEKYGQDTFRLLEQEMLQEVGSFENVLISTGGGTPCYFDNMDYMKGVGEVVYLSASAEELCQRLSKAKSTRPLIKNKTDEELLVFIEENLLQRSPFYEQASINFDTGQLLTSQQVVLKAQELEQLIQQHFV